jgi:hypothetical protein
LGIYIGIKEKAKPEVFERETDPTKETHPRYNFIYGPCKTVEDAQRYIKAMGELACGES